MRPRIAALVATTVLGLVVGLTSPAYADKYAGEDAAGDVVTFDEDFVEGLAPDHTDTDVVKAVVRHGRSRVALRLRVRDLHRVQQKDSFQTSMEVWTNRGLWSVALVKYEFSTFVDITKYSGRRQDTVRCRGVQRTVSAADDLVRLSVPRRCLGNPRWVKVAPYTVFTSEADIYFDNAFRTGSALSDQPKFTPKLKRA